jgi:hypothetical protein
MNVPRNQQINATQTQIVSTFPVRTTVVVLPGIVGMENFVQVYIKYFKIGSWHVF